jgi:hypothetical protein
MKTVNTFFIILFLIQNLAIAVDQPAEPIGVDSQFSTPTNLTDKQMENARTFVHQGQRDRVYQEGCKDADDCKFEEGFPVEMMIGKAYGMIGLFSGDGMSPNLNMKATTAQLETAKSKPLVNGKPAKPDHDKKKDYCMMAAMVWESVGGMIQQALQKKADNTTTSGDAQLQALVSLQQTHKARQETAKYQSYVYGAVTACYVTMMFTGIDLSDPMLWVKFGGAAALTGLYMKKAAKHRNAAEKVGQVIDSMEWAGKNCNPWTRTTCFCSESTSKTLYSAQYEEVCVLNKGNFDTPKVALGCASVQGDQIQYDKECKCKQSNSCLKSGLKGYNPEYGMNNNLMKDVNKTFDLLATGDYDKGELDRATLKTMATASRLKMKGLDKFNTPTLSDEQQKMAQALGDYMPEKLAQIAAASKPGSLSKIQEPSFSSGNLSKLSPKIKQQLARAIDAGYSKNGGGNSSSGSDGPDFTMPTFGSKNAEETGGAEVMEFAEKAQMKAEITNQPSTPIFEIISNRYQRSGWQKLDTQGN